MKQSKYIFLVALLSVVFANSAYSQKNWEMREYPTYRWHEEWILAANIGFTASDYMHWGLGGIIGKKLNPFWTIRTEAYVHSVQNDDFIGKFGYYVNVGLGAYTRIADNVYFNVEDKVFCMTNFDNFAFYNYLSIGFVVRINSNTRPRW